MEKEIKLAKWGNYDDLRKVSLMQTESFPEGKLQVYYDIVRNRTLPHRIKILAIYLPDGRIVYLDKVTKRETISEILEELYDESVGNILRAKETLIKSQKKALEFEIEDHDVLISSASEGFLIHMRVSERDAKGYAISRYTIKIDPLDFFDPSTWRAKYDVRREVLSRRAYFALPKETTLNIRLEWTGRTNKGLHTDVGTLYGIIGCSKEPSKSVLGILQMRSIKDKKCPATFQLANFLQPLFKAEDEKYLRELSNLIGKEVVIKNL